MSPTGEPLGVSEPLSDEQLMLAYAAGDTRAFEQLYGRHKRPLFAFVMRGLSTRALAEECFQEVWSRVIQSRARYRPDARFTTWMFQIAHNLLVDQYRRQRPTVDLDEARDDVEGQSEAPARPEAVLSEFERRRALQLAMDALPVDQRVVLLLRLEQELPLEEIASITGVGRETVKSRLRYAMDKLRERLGAPA